LTTRDGQGSKSIKTVGGQSRPRTPIKASSPAPSGSVTQYNGWMKSIEGAPPQAEENADSIGS